MAKGISEGAEWGDFSTIVQGQEIHPLQSKRNRVKRIMYVSISRCVWLTEIVEHLHLFKRLEWMMDSGCGELGVFFFFCCGRLQEKYFFFYFGKGIKVSKFEVA